MTSRIKSAFLRRTNSIKRPTFDGVKDTIRAHRPNISNDTSYGSNEYIHQHFFDGDNYNSIIKCLDEGYKIATTLIEYMEDYCELLQEHARGLTSYSNKWSSKLKQQSSLSSYHTTKRAQLQTIASPNQLAQLIESRCEAIQQVITTYRSQVERMYLSERLGTIHKHNRSDSMKKAFKTARMALSKLTDTLEKLHEQEIQAQSDLHDAKVQCENLSFASPVSKSKVSRAEDNQEKKQYVLDDVQEKITRTEQEYSREQEIYLEKAMDIYKQCRALEKERLEQIRETLIKFSQAAHTSEYSAGQDAVFDNLVANIKTQQDSMEDLDFWAQTYHANILTKSISSETNSDTHNTDSQTTTRKSKKSHKNESENLTTPEETSQQSAIEDKQEQSAADTTTTSVTTRAKKNKNSTSTEKKNNTATEPTTPNATKSNQI